MMVMRIAAAGIKREDGNELVKQIARRYEDDVIRDGGPWGHTFAEMYDLRKLTLQERFLELYDRMKKELEDLDSRIDVRVTLASRGCISLFFHSPRRR